MARPQESQSSPMLTLTSVVVVIAILYFAQEVLLPIALAVLLSFILAPLVMWLERRRLGRIPSVLLAVTFAFAVIGAIGWMVADEVVDLARDVPKYQETLTRKIRDLRRAPVGGDVVTGVTEAAKEIGKELAGAPEGDKPAPATGVPAGSQPVPVYIVESSPFALRFLRNWLGPVMAPLGTAALVIIFVIFMLLSREDLRNRLIRLAGTGRVYVTTQAFDEAGARISRYLLMQLIINATYGLAAALGLYFIGVPSAFLWGLLAMALRFVPYVGPWIAAICPIVLSLAVFENWTRPLATVGLFLILELVSNNVMEPWLYGTSTGVSTVGIIVAAVFWTWLWGPLGLVLSMPLTVCLTVLGRHVPRLNFLNVLLSDEPALDLDVRFYQRLLALDYNEASDLIEQFLRTGTWDELYERMLVPALSLAERDRHAGNLGEHQVEFIHRSVSDLIDELANEFEKSAAAETVPSGASEEHARRAADDQTEARRSLHILCVPAEDESDRIAGKMLVQLLSARGHRSTTVPVRATDPELPDAIREHQAEWVVISALAPGGAMQARDGCRRIRSHSPGASILVGLWNAGGSLEGTRERLISAGATIVATRLSEGIEQLQGAAPRIQPSEAATASRTTAEG